MDYLCARSTFLRGLFAGANPLDLVSVEPPSTELMEDYGSNIRKESLPFNVPTNRLPHLLPSSPTHPVLFLPVPDPTSFHLLVHWMYFGHTDYIEDCLNRGFIHLAGIRRNAEYLGLPDDVIGTFFRRWERGWRNCHLYPSPHGSESSDSEDDYSFSSEYDTDMDMEEEPRRGRTTTARHLLHSSKLQTDRASSA